MWQCRYGEYNFYLFRLAVELLLWPAAQGLRPCYPEIGLDKPFARQRDDFVRIFIIFTRGGSRPRSSPVSTSVSFRRLNLPLSEKTREMRSILARFDQCSSDVGLRLCLQKMHFLTNVGTINTCTFIQMFLKVFGAIRSKDRSYFDRSELSTLSKLQAKFSTQVSLRVQYFSVFNY